LNPNYPLPWNCPHLRGLTRMSELDKRPPSSDERFSNRVD
jgi:hypothetical protein